MKRTYALVYIAAWLLFAACLALAWYWTPLRTINTAQLMRWSEPFARHPAAPGVIVVAYAASAFVFFPRPLLTLSFIVIFGPWRTAVFGLAGLLLAAAAAFWFGARHGAPRTRALAAHGLDALAARLRRGGIYSIIAIRMLPLAPFTIVNLFAGALRVSFRDFIVGSFFGLLPGTLVTIVIGDRLLAALRHADWSNIIIAGAIAAAAALTFLLLRRSVR